MPLRAHLLELRKRLFLASIGVVVGAVVAWVFYDQVFAAIQRPLEMASRTRDDLVTLNFAGVAAPFDMQVKVALFLGVIVSSPWWLYQLWAFITPGLTRRERGYAFGFLGAAVPLFLGGAVLAWWVLPHAVQLLIEFTPAGATNLVDAQTYLGFVMRVMLVFGIAFLLPVVMVALNFAGLGTAATWRKGWRWAVMIAFTFAAVATPTPDAITMIAVAIPICLLYAGALGVCVLHDRRVDRRRVAEGLPRLDGTFPDEAPTDAGTTTA
ncbi:twin-arginine translocase subunit TatC [Cellulomonas fimi]|uniref:Sec-independent protein translocase protein TatC n=1 Tax=Cellulomonas fimi (strain ATCC 484 / DSM 20113 / JCM 1341 / CCUG 24087 / LMG 16345 / NBRC 15513 / NCIMB 8980 / NCTC 7547 / NRS-133) TaxID=590998 RepID=F4GZN8_CELFA|nr:twin-arginine translocase subunit TatC [Cellulomonas fimi]AEE46082.1 Sec-independent protein translocase, TatC subunit [Cellulomonas fimi ATCC 484]NNH06933.1 twin-arginine translocase subunit TatC [Cellulomonas fimi]VEH31557.1 Sec-independent protein translocase protein TatC [Cellulomonas fimi]